MALEEYVFRRGSCRVERGGREAERNGGCPQRWRGRLNPSRQDGYFFLGPLREHEIGVAALFKVQAFSDVGYGKGKKSSADVGLADPQRFEIFFEVFHVLLN